MKRLTLKLLALSAIVYVFVWLMNTAAAERSVADPNVLRLQVAAHITNIDTLVLGSSYAYSAVIPTELGISDERVFNLGMPTASVEFYEVLYDDFVKSHVKPPARVLLNLSLLTASPIADQWTSYPIHRYISHPISNEALVVRTGHYRLWPKLFVNEARFSMKRLYKSGAPTALREQIRRDFGFRPSDEVYSEKIFRSERSYYLQNATLNFDKHRTQKLVRFAEGLRDHKVAVVFFEVPSNRLAEFYSTAYKAQYEQYVEALKSMAFTVLSCPLAFTANEFRNIDHMNTAGARRYSQWLGKALAALP